MLHRVIFFFLYFSRGNSLAFDYFPFFSNHSPKSRLIQLKKEKLEYTPGEHEYGLFPAPIHVGEYSVYTVYCQKEMVFLEFRWNVINVFVFWLFLYLQEVKSLPFNLYSLWRILKTLLLSRGQNVNLIHWSVNSNTLSVTFDSLSESSRKTQLFHYFSF